MKSPPCFNSPSRFMRTLAALIAAIALNKAAAKELIPPSIENAHNDYTGYGYSWFNVKFPGSGEPYHYKYTKGLFGKEPGGMSGQVVKAVPFDACSPLENAEKVKENIVLVKNTGSCWHAERANHVQDAGGIFMLESNSDGRGMTVMGPNMYYGEVAKLDKWPEEIFKSVDIGVASISDWVGDTLLSWGVKEDAAGVVATFEKECAPHCPYSWRGDWVCDLSCGSEECGWDATDDSWGWSDCHSDWFCAPYCANNLKEEDQFKCSEPCMNSDCNIHFKEDCEYALSFYIFSTFLTRCVFLSIAGPDGAKDPWTNGQDGSENGEETKPPSIQEDEKDSNVPLAERDCDVTFTLRDASGVFTDGSPPDGPYESNTVKCWHIQAKSGVISLHLYRFQTEPMYDTVTIYDGASWKNGTAILEELSDHLDEKSVSDFEVKSSGADMFIRFEADSEFWEMDKGFEFYYHAYKPTQFCGDKTPKTGDLSRFQRITSESGTIATQSLMTSQASYLRPPYTDFCAWLVRPGSPTPAKEISLNFEKLDLFGHHTIKVFSNVRDPVDGVDPIARINKFGCHGPACSSDVQVKHTGPELLLRLNATIAHLASGESGDFEYEEDWNPKVSRFPPKAFKGFLAHFSSVPHCWPSKDCSGNGKCVIDDGNRASCECNAPYSGSSCFKMANVYLLETKIPKTWLPLSSQSKMITRYVGDEKSRYYRLDVPKLEAHYGIRPIEPVFLRLAFHVETPLSDVILRGKWASKFVDILDHGKWYPSPLVKDFELSLGDKEIIFSSCDIKKHSKNQSALYLEVYGAHVAHKRSKAEIMITSEWIRTFIAIPTLPSGTMVKGSICCGQSLQYVVDSGAKLVQETKKSEWGKIAIYDWFIEVYAYLPLKRVRLLGTNDDLCVQGGVVDTPTASKGMYTFNMSKYKSKIEVGHLALRIDGSENDDHAAYEVHIRQVKREFAKETKPPTRKKNKFDWKGKDEDDDSRGIIIAASCISIVVTAASIVLVRRKYYKGMGNVAPMQIEVRPDPSGTGGYQIRSSQGQGQGQGQDESPWVPIPDPGGGPQRKTSVVLKKGKGKKAQQVEMNFLHSPGSIPGELGTPQFAKAEPTFAQIVNDTDDMSASPSVPVAVMAPSIASNPFGDVVHAQATEVDDEEGTDVL